MSWVATFLVLYPFYFISFASERKKRTTHNADYVCYIILAFMKIVRALFLLLYALPLAAQNPDEDFLIEDISANDSSLQPQEQEEYFVSMFFDETLFEEDTVIHWIPAEEAEEAQRLEPKKIFVDVYANWCRWCRLSDSVVFRHSDVARFVNRYFHSVKFDAELQQSARFFGREFHSVHDSGNNYHELPAYLLDGNLSYPGFVFADENGEIIYRYNGYLSASNFETLLDFIASDAYLETDFQEFEKSFSGKIPD